MNRQAASTAAPELSASLHDIARARRESDRSDKIIYVLYVLVLLLGGVALAFFLRYLAVAFAA